MRKSFKDSLKALEADIQHANTLASVYPREYDGACIQMRISYSPVAHLFLFLVQWTDCHFAGALGLLRILIYKAYVDGKTTMSIHEKKASIREFYAVIFPSLLQLQRGITDVEDRKQKEICATKYRKKDEPVKGPCLFKLMMFSFYVQGWSHSMSRDDLSFLRPISFVKFHRMVADSTLRRRFCFSRLSITTTKRRMSSQADRSSNESKKKVNELDAAAVKLHKVYKGYRTRRNLADCVVVVEELWWKGLDFCLLEKSSISFFENQTKETAISRWARAGTRAAKVGKGLLKDAMAQIQPFPQWLEIIDPYHRYFRNLHFYYDVWFDSDTVQPFFYWLDVGDGKEVDLEKCSRSNLQRQCIQYLASICMESIESINKILEEANKRIQPTGTVELFGALRARLNDSNKNLGSLFQIYVKKPSGAENEEWVWKAEPLKDTLVLLSS